MLTKKRCLGAFAPAVRAFCLQFRAALKGTNVGGQTPICNFLQESCGFLRVSARICASQTLCFLGRGENLCKTQRNSAKICVWAWFIPLVLCTLTIEVFCLQWEVGLSNGLSAKTSSKEGPTVRKTVSLFFSWRIFWAASHKGRGVKKEGSSSHWQPQEPQKPRD